MRIVCNVGIVDYFMSGKCGAGCSSGEGGEEGIVKKEGEIESKEKS
jgi:hypothetical protein